MPKNIRVGRSKNLSFFLSVHTVTPSLEDYEHVYILHTGFAGWKSTSSHVTTVGSLTCTGGDSRCKGGLQLTARSEGRRTYLVSSLQMTLRKACSDTGIFPRLPRGSNPWPLALKASALTTRLPCFHLFIFLSKTDKIRFHYRIKRQIDIIGYFIGSTRSKFVSASFKSFTFPAEGISMWPLISYRINLNISC